MGFYLARVGIVLVPVLSILIVLLGGLADGWIVMNYPNLNQYIEFFAGVAMFSLGCFGTLAFSSMAAFPLLLLEKTKIYESYPKLFNYGLIIYFLLVSFFIAKYYGQIFHDLHECAYLVCVFIVNPIVVIVFFLEDKIKD